MHMETIVGALIDVLHRQRTMHHNEHTAHRSNKFVHNFMYWAYDLALNEAVMSLYKFSF